MHKKLKSDLHIKLCLLFIIVSIYSKGVHADKFISIAYFTEKYPFIYTDFKTGMLTGIDIFITDKMKTLYGYSVLYEKYDKKSKYDCIMGGVIKSDALLRLFGDYSFLEYYRDNVVIYAKTDSLLSYESFLSLYRHELIGILLYSYGYYLLKDVYKNARFYAYSADLIADLQQEKIRYAIMDELYYDTDENLGEKPNDMIKKIKDLYSESIGLLYLKNRSDVANHMDAVISKFGRKELFQWSK